MTSNQLRLLAAIYAAMTRVEGMVAENKCREAAGSSPAYGEDAFLQFADHLDQLSTEAANS